MRDLGFYSINKGDITFFYHIKGRRGTDIDRHSSRNIPGKKIADRFRSRYSPIGIDIGSALIKAVQLRQSRGTVALHCRAVVPTPAGTFGEGAAIEPAVLAEALSSLRRKRPWHKNRVNFILGARSFYLRRITMPPMTGGELEKAMYWEVEKQFPLSACEAVFSYCPAEPFKGKEQPRGYLLAASPKAVSRAYTEAADRAGFYCATLEVLPLALLRSLQFNSPARAGKGPGAAAFKKQAPRLLLDIGFKNSAILVSIDNRYLFYRNVQAGTGHFCRSLEERPGFDKPSALRRLFESKTLLEKGLNETADQYAARIEKSIAYWADQPEHRADDLLGIEFCGGGAFIPGLASRIEKKLSLKRLLYNPLSPVTGSRPGGHTARYREEVLFSAAHGLALRGWLK